MFWFVLSLQLAEMRYHKDIIIQNRKKYVLVKECINYTNLVSPRWRIY